MDAQTRNLVMVSIESLVEHGHEPPFVAVIPRFFITPLDGAETIITDYGDVEIVKRAELGPNLLYIMTRAGHEEQYG